MSDFTGSAIDHMGIGVLNISRAQVFYEGVLRPLGISLIMRIEADPSRSKPQRLGFGFGQKPFLWLHDATTASHGAHIALVAPSRESVDAFHAAGIAAGGQDNGAPGIRPHFHADYYAAYVVTPDGVNLEAVCQATA